MPKRKPVVLYRADEAHVIVLGMGAYVFPVNHPNVANVSNTHHVRTTMVIRHDKDGEFETENSIYRSYKKENENGPQQTERGLLPSVERK